MHLKAMSLSAKWEPLEDDDDSIFVDDFDEDDGSDME